MTILELFVEMLDGIYSIITAFELPFNDALIFSPVNTVQLQVLLWLRYYKNDYGSYPPIKAVA